MAEGAQGVCSARQVGFGLATAVAGLTVTTVVAFRAMKAYRDWAYVLGCAGSVGAGLLVAKFSARTPAATVGAPDVQPEEQRRAGDPLERALAGSFDAEFASLDRHPGSPGGLSPTTRAGVRAEHLRIKPRYAERTWPGLCELDGWLCDQGLELEQVLEQGPREEVLRIVLDGCPRYCKEKVGLSNLYAQVGWIAGDELKRAVGDYLKVLCFFNDMLLEVMVDHLDAASFEWLADESHPQDVEIKRDGSRLETLMLKVFPRWTRSGFSVLLGPAVYRAWTIIYHPDALIGLPSVPVGSIAKVLLEELLPTVTDNEWKGRQGDMVGDPKSGSWESRGLWAELEVEQQADVLLATCGSNNYQLLYPYVDLGEQELVEAYLAGITQRDQREWLLGQDRIRWEPLLGRSGRGGGRTRKEVHGECH